MWMRQQDSYSAQVLALSPCLYQIHFWPYSSTVILRTRGAFHAPRTMSVRTESRKMPASAFEGKVVKAFSQRPSTLYRARYLPDASFSIAPNERLPAVFPLVTGRDPGAPYHAARCSTLVPP